MFYNLNLFDGSLTNRLELDNDCWILPNRTNMKHIYKTELVKDQTDKNTRFGNNTNYLCYFNKSTILWNDFISTISKIHLSKSKSYYILKMLLLNSDSKTVSDLIYLWMLLNQL